MSRLLLLLLTCFGGFSSHCAESSGNYSPSGFVGDDSIPSGLRLHYLPLQADDNGEGGGGPAAAVTEELPPVMLKGRQAKSYRGIDNPSTTIGFDVWGDYLSTQSISGDRGSATLSCVGTAANPCAIDALNANFTKLKISGSYLVFQGGTVNAPAERGPFVLLDGCQFCVVRDVTVNGPGIDSAYSAAVGLGPNVVWIGGTIQGFGDIRPEAREQDFHGIKTMGPGPTWILEAEIYNNSGDSVQVGDASRGVSNDVYIGGGIFRDNRENGVDIKDSNNIVVSGVVMSGFSPTQSDPGSAIVIHDDAFNAKIFDNIITDSNIGIVSSGADGHIINGNRITAEAVGIQLRNTRNLSVTDNVISAPLPVEVQSGTSGKIQRR